MDVSVTHASTKPQTNVSLKCLSQPRSQGKHRLFDASDASHSHRFTLGPAEKRLRSGNKSVTLHSLKYSEDVPLPL